MAEDAAVRGTCGELRHPRMEQEETKPAAGVRFHLCSPQASRILTQTSPHMP